MKMNTGKAAAGGLFRDETGKWLYGFWVNLGSCSALMAELWGAWYVLKIAWERGYRRLILEIDSLLAVNMIIKKHKQVNNYHSLLIDIFRLLDLQWNVRMQHTLREDNCGADVIANLGIQMVLACHMFDRASYDVHEIVLRMI